MKKLTLTQFGNPILRAKAHPVPLSVIADARFQRLIKDMFFTMEGIGVGLAAPQIGQPLQLAVIEIKPTSNRSEVEAFPKTVIINPKITKYSRESQIGWEGCLSCSDEKGDALLWGMVPRAKRVEVKYYDEHGKLHKQTHTGFTACVFQHEIDHLNGMVFVDRMKDMKTLSTPRGFKQAGAMRK